MKQGDELVATYEIDGQAINVYGCWDSETPEGKYDFFDIYDCAHGDCLNLGEPFYTRPTQAEVEAFLTAVKEAESLELLRR